MMKNRKEDLMYFEATPYYGEKDDFGNEPILGWGVWTPSDGEWVIEDGLTEAEAKTKADELNRSCGNEY